MQPRKSLSLLKTLVVNELKRQYLGSYLGIAWAFIQPLALVAALYFVATIGFRASEIPGHSDFLLWLIAGLFPWLAFANSLSGGAASITSNAHLVKKIHFELVLLPVVKIFGVYFIHLVFIALMILLLYCRGGEPSLGQLQLIYYSFSLFVLVLALSLLISAITVFVRDALNAVAIAIQLGFWITPIFWNIDSVPPDIKAILMLNPVAYIVEGYRDSISGGPWFWDNIKAFSIFWLEALTLLALGKYVFHKTSPHFGDVI